MKIFTLENYSNICKFDQNYKLWFFVEVFIDVCGKFDKNIVCNKIFTKTKSLPKNSKNVLKIWSNLSKKYFNLSEKLSIFGNYFHFELF